MGETGGTTGRDSAIRTVRCRRLAAVAGAAAAAVVVGRRPRHQLVGRTPVHNPFERHLGSHGVAAAPSQPFQLAGRVRVGVDGERTAELHRQAQQVLGRVLALGPGVDLDGCPGRGARGEDRLRVERRLRPALAGDEPPGAVAEDVGVRALDRPPTIRAVMSLASIRSLEWTLATTTSSSPSMSGSWSSEPSSRMSTSIPVRMPERRQLLVHLGHHLELWRRRSALSPWATVSRAEWSVSDEVLAAEVPCRLGHLEDRAAAVGPVRVGVAVAPQRREQRRRRPVEHQVVVVARRVEFGEIRGDLVRARPRRWPARRRLAHALDGLRAARPPPAWPARRRACDLMARAAWRKARTL